MNQNCSQCGSIGAPQARFCQNCGATYGATLVQGRTVVAASPLNPTAPGLAGPPLVFQAVPPTVGPRTFLPGGGADNASSAGQRELTLIVHDISSSMTEDYDGRFTKIEAARRAAASMIINKYRIDPQDEVGLVTFNDEACTVMGLCPLSAHKRDLLEALQSLEAGGATDINEGLKAAETAFQWGRQGIVRRIILLTDGHGGYPLRMAEKLKSRGVVIDVTGVGDTAANVDEQLLRKVASVVQGETRYRFIKDQQTLVNHYTQLASKTAVA